MNTEDSDSCLSNPEMGCGKTLTAITVMGVLYKKKKISRVLIVAPTTVVSVWPRDMAEFAEFPFVHSILLGTKANRITALENLIRYNYDKLKVAVINYESVWREGLIEEIVKYNPEMIICDESQRIKGHNSKQSQAMHKLGDLALYKMILSGTPLQNNVTDLWSQYRFLDKSVFGEYYYPFQNRYCLMHAVFKTKVIKTINQTELSRKEHSIAYRVTKEECLDLPEQTFETRTVEMSKKERRLYEELKQEAVLSLEDGGTITAATVLTKLLRLQQFTGGFLKRDGAEAVEQISTTKLEALSDIIEDYVLTTRKKLVIFARFTAEVEAIKSLSSKLISSEEMRVVSLQGSVPKEQRGNIVQDFQTNPKVMIMVGQIDTAGVGLTLTAADTVVYYSKTWNYATYEQSLSRIHRIGQRNTCTYIDLVCEKSIDSQITAALKKKQDLSKTIVDDWKKFFLKNE